MTAERSTGSGETVLVIEDEPEVRMVERILTKNGYSVVGASTGADAVKIFNQSEQAIDLLLTDVIMPEMLGPELVERVRKIRLI